MKKPFIICLVVIPFVSSGFIALLGALYLIFANDFDILDLWMTIVSVFVFIVSSFFYHLLKNDFKLKYFFLPKTVKKDLENSVAKFGKVSEDFNKEYVKFCKNHYRTLGNLKILAPCYYNNIYKKKDYALSAKNTLLKLLSYIEDGSGFIGFFEDINSLSNDDDNTPDTYYIYEHLGIEILPKEFRYLITQVYRDTGFCFIDNKLSETFTEQNDKAIEKTKSVYNPILFMLKSDVLETIEKLSEI